MKEAEIWLGQDIGKEAEILDGGWWISDSEKIISTNPEPRVVAKTATGGNEGVRKFWMLDLEFWDGEANVGFLLNGALGLNLGAARRSASAF